MTLEKKLAEANKERWDSGKEWRGYLQTELGLVFEDRVLKVFGLLEPTGGTYLDVGCSDGVLTKQFSLKTKAAETYGVDLREPEDAKANGVAASQVDLNSEPLPFKDNSFDVVTCIETLEHVITPEHVLSEINRVLKPSGYAVFSVPRIDSVLSILLLTLGYQPPAVECSAKKRCGTLNKDSRVSGHVSNFTKKAFMELLNESGFKATEVRGASLYSGWYLMRQAAGKKPDDITSILLKILSKLPVKQDVLIVKARKNHLPYYA